MKAKIMISAVLLTTGLEISVVSSPVSAASWHKGTPKAIRGRWIHKDKVPLGSDIVIATHHTYEWNSSGMPSHLFKHPHWKYLGKHKYEIYGYVASVGFGRAGYQRSIVSRHGRYLNMSGEYFHRF
jgi:hypothetical protein